MLIEHSLHKTVQKEYVSVTSLLMKYRANGVRRNRLRGTIQVSQRALPLRVG